MKYPIGIQTFEKLIEGGYLYVDKTEMIYQLVTSGEYYFICRPRRFGKSLLTTTLEAYFQGKKELFKGLAMERLEKDWVTYPVLHLDFSGNKYTEDGELSSVVNLFLEKGEELYGKNDSEVTFGSRFQGVIQRAFEKTGRKVVVLVDEYDKPLTDTIGDEGLQNANREILQSIYSVFKNSDRYLRFTFLTGVTRYAKLGVFSAANNLNDISMSKKYASICGISEAELHAYFDDEVKAFAEEEEVSVEEMYASLKLRYDGYHFCEKSADIYNPFSLLCALNARQISNYWFATGTPTYLAKVLAKSDVDVPEFEDGLMATGEMLATFGNGESNVIAAFYQSGYLTIKDFRGGCYVLGFPNEEVSEGMTRVLIPNYVNTATSDRKDLDLIKLRQLIEVNDVDSFMNQIQLILSQVPFESHNERLIEANFRNMLYLAIRSTGHRVTVEHPVLGGRIDVFFETEKCAYIIECKRNGSAQEALKQIDVKQYAKKISSPNKQVVKIGVNFSTEDRNMTEWVKE